MRIIILAVVAVACAGCASLFSPAAEKAAEAVVKYCEREPFQARQLYRNTINAQMPPGYSVNVTCAGDPE